MVLPWREKLRDKFWIIRVFHSSTFPSFQPNTHEEKLNIFYHSTNFPSSHFSTPLTKRTLRDTTWVKKNSLFLFTHCSLPHYIFSLPLSIFLFSFACSHSRSSARLHFSPQSHLLGLLSFSLGLHIFTPWDFTSPVHLHWPNGLSIYFFIFSFFSPFHNLHIKSQ